MIWFRRACMYGYSNSKLVFFLLSLAFCWSRSLEASLHVGWSRMQKRRKCNHKYLQFAFMVMGLHIPNIKMLADSALNQKMPAVEFTAFVCLFSLKRERQRLICKWYGFLPIHIALNSPVLRASHQNGNNSRDCSQQQQLLPHKNYRSAKISLINLNVCIREKKESNVGLCHLEKMPLMLCNLIFVNCP